MKIKISTSRLNEALKKVSGISNGKASLAILGNVKVEVSGNRMTLTTSNLDTTLISVTDCDEVTEHGMTTVPMKIFSQVVGALPQGIAEITVDAKDNMKVVSANSTFRIGGLPGKEFPTLPSDDSSLNCKVKASALRELIRKTSYAMSSDDSRKTFMSILFEFRNGSLRTVATDGRRLAMCDQEGVCDVGANAQYIIPREAIPMIARLIEVDGDIVVTSSHTQICFRTDDMSHFVYTKLVDGKYGAYERLIPSEREHTAEIDRVQLMDVLSRVIIMLTSTETVKLEFSKGVLNIDVVGDSNCAAHDMLPIKYDDEDITLPINPKYVLDVLKSVNSDVIKFSFSTPPTAENQRTKPSDITADGEPFVAVIMPKHIA